jgi:hypothetical protein
MVENLSSFSASHIGIFATKSTPFIDAPRVVRKWSAWCWLSGGNAMSPPAPKQPSCIGTSTFQTDCNAIHFVPLEQKEAIGFRSQAKTGSSPGRFVGQTWFVPQFGLSTVHCSKGPGGFSLEGVNTKWFSGDPANGNRHSEHGMQCRKQPSPAYYRSYIGGADTGEAQAHHPILHVMMTMLKHCQKPHGSTRLLGQPLSSTTRQAWYQEGSTLNEPSGSQHSKFTSQRGSTWP